MRPYTWKQLRGLSLARQFPRLRGSGADAVARLVQRIGPLQTQTARSAFVGVAARVGVGFDAITQAYERRDLVRGSLIRGTVHTCTPAQQRLLDHVTRLTLHRSWKVALGDLDLAHPLWREIQTYAGAPRTAAELHEHALTWLAERAPEAVESFGVHGRGLFRFGGLVRRPLHGSRWDNQSEPGYLTLAAALAEVDTDLDEPAGWAERSDDDVVTAVVAMHVRHHGPVSRFDTAWWSGLGLRRVDDALERLGREVTHRPGPDGRDYWDLADQPRPVTDVGTRLLPEFDALLCGYDPKARDRFIAPAHHALLWNTGNLLMMPSVLHDGVVTGTWRLDGSGAKPRTLTVRAFDDVPQPTDADLAPAVSAVEAALDIRVERPS